LHCACGWGKADVVNILLERGADTSLTDDVSFNLHLFLFLLMATRIMTPRSLPQAEIIKIFVSTYSKNLKKRRRSSNHSAAQLKKFK
jgi:hypothetical protein